jgi:hypothetical protein
MAPVPLTILTMSRGDAGRLEEWVGYHARLGFEEFHVLLDGLIDDSDEVLESLDVGARIVVHRFPEEGVYLDGLSASDRIQAVREWRADNAEMLAALPHNAVDPLALRQRQRVPGVLAQVTHGRRGWVAFIDVDEFIHLPGGGSVRELTEAATAPRLQLYSFNVDTTGHDPSRPVLEQHSMRWSREDVEAHPDGRWATRVKSIVRYRKALPFKSIHRISLGRHEKVDPDVARLHHFRMPLQPLDPPIPYSVDDPISMPTAPRRT